MRCALVKSEFHWKQTIAPQLRGCDHARSRRAVALSRFRELLDFENPSPSRPAPRPTRVGPFDRRGVPSIRYADNGPGEQSLRRVPSPMSEEFDRLLPKMRVRRGKELLRAGKCRGGRLVSR